jgi:hypothetical protein
MKGFPGFLLVCVLLLMFSCRSGGDVKTILQKTVTSIDTIESIHYTQVMTRTNPRDLQDTLYRFRKMYFSRLRGDSIVG